MLLEKKRIRQIIRDHKITSFKEKDEEELANIFYESLTEMGHFQEERLATKEDIKMLLELMNRRFEAVVRRFEAVDKRFEDMYKYMDKRFEDMNKKFSMMFTFMNIGFGIIILLTILFTSAALLSPSLAFAISVRQM